MKLSGKVALVTGGTSGIGLATARCFIEEGATTYVTGLSEAAVVEAALALGPGATVLRSDVTDAADIAGLFETIRRESGRIDVVFANAGIGAKAYLGEITVDQIDSLFGVNVRGMILTVQGALPLLQPGASIILNAGIIASKGYAGWTVYSATKAAVRSFARTWSAELSPRGIRVNVVSPGVIETPGYARMGFEPAQEAEFMALTAGITPLMRNGSAEEVARAVVFLASGDSSFVGGTELFVDGGTAQV
jgi:NAD(P)-dependent dehydrogenase (short-subunit alcohol dehydrogenase family)